MSTTQALADAVGTLNQAAQVYQNQNTAINAAVTDMQARADQKIQELNDVQPEKRIVQTIRIEGSSDYLYPVWFSFPGHDFGVGKLQISRHYTWNPGVIHPSHTAALLCEIEGNGTRWGGDANFLEIKRFNEKYHVCCSNVAFSGYARYRQEGATLLEQPENSFGPQCPRYSTVYLRGGGLDYRFSSNWNVTLSHSLESTRVWRSDVHGSWYVEPIHIDDRITPVYDLNAYVDPI